MVSSLVDVSDSEVRGGVIRINDVSQCTQQSSPHFISFGFVAPGLHYILMAYFGISHKHRTYLCNWLGFINMFVKAPPEPLFFPPYADDERPVGSIATRL